MEGLSGDTDAEVSDPTGGDGMEKNKRDDQNVHLKFPNSDEVRSYESSFEPSHAEVRHKAFTGSLVIRSGTDTGGVAVYLDGWPVYAYYTDSSVESYGVEAFDSLMDLSGSIDRHISTEEEVEMFRTYVEFLGEAEGLLNIAEVKAADVIERTILVTAGGKLEKVNLPPGRRIGYAPNSTYAGRYFVQTGKTGYALSNSTVIYYENGREVNRNEFKSDKGSMLVRMESEKGLNDLECLYVDIFAEHSTSAVENVDVEFDIRGWEVVESEEIVRGDEDEDDGGFISKIFG